LVVGGIFLADITLKGSRDNRGVWLLVDHQPPNINGIDYRPAKSTIDSKFPLIWAHATSLAVVSDMVKNKRLSESFGEASEKILYAKRIAGDRDALQEQKKKRRLSDFWDARSMHLFPDEVDEEIEYREGAKRLVTVNAYERDSKARRRCIQHYGARCYICQFSFSEFYGEVAEGMIHIHHLRPLSEIGQEYRVDPVKDLRPVCPNCHAVLHLRKNAVFTIEDVKEFVRSQKAKQRGSQ
jgi:predicted HNH restriction endonuclease